MKTHPRTCGGSLIVARPRRLNPRGALAIRTSALVATVLFCLPAWGAYTIQPGDTIEISVAGIPELRQRTTVQPDGAIAFPLVGAVAVEGLTPAELRTAVQTQLARKIYRLRGNDGKEILTVIQPEDVSAAIVGYRPVYVTGDVARPGEQTFRPDMTVRQALALAGGAESLQARFPKPSRDFSTVKSEYELALADLAQAKAKIARVTAELNGENELAGLDFSGLRLPKETLAGIRKNETDILQAGMAAYQREHDFLKAAIDQADDRIAVIQKQQEEEQEGSRADTVELRRLLDLLNKGQETTPRVTEARRALLLSSTRALQVQAELLELKRQKSENASAFQRFEDERRVALLKELEDAASARTAAHIKIQGLESELRLAAHPPALDDFEDDMQRIIEIVRQDRGESKKSIVDENFVLMPGDVIKVSFRAPEKSTNNDR